MILSWFPQSFLLSPFAFLQFLFPPITPSFPNLVFSSASLFPIFFLSQSSFSRPPFSWRSYNVLINFNGILMNTMWSKSIDFAKIFPESILYISVWLASRWPKVRIVSRRPQHSLFADLVQVGSGVGRLWFKAFRPDPSLLLSLPPPNPVRLVFFLSSSLSAFPSYIPLINHSWFSHKHNMNLIKCIYRLILQVGNSYLQCISLALPPFPPLAPPLPLLLALPLLSHPP